MEKLSENRYKFEVTPNLKCNTEANEINFNSMREIFNIVLNKKTGN